MSWKNFGWQRCFCILIIAPAISCLHAEEDNHSIWENIALTDDFQSLNDWRGDYGIKTEFELTSVYPEIKTE